jgi:membrane protein YdbS with pleckstrin-like domain
MPRIDIDKIESTTPAPAPKEVPLKVPDHSAIVDKSDPNGTNALLRAKSSNSVLSAFCAFPEKVTFAGEDEDETIILLMRAHPITNVRWMLISLLLLVVPAILFPILMSISVIPAINPGTNFVFVLLWLMGVFSYSFINFLYWYFNVYIVTNERVVDVDWYSIIYHNTDATRISKIQEVSSSHSGVFASIFDYGNVDIQTAGEEQVFDFIDLPHPDLVSKKIQEIMELEEKEWEVKPDE